MESFYKKLGLESRTQGENCVMGSRQRRPWSGVHMSHIKAFELYNSPAQMDYLKTQIQYLFLRPMPLVRL